jgi:hypothetical protein
MIGAPRYCFILGAGFSKAFSKYAPTMAGFLTQAKDAGVYNPTGNHKPLAMIADRYFGSETMVNIEDLATFLLSDLGPNPQKEGELRLLAYDQLTRIISRTLSGAHCNPNPGVDKVFQELAQFAATHGAPVLTFNYDLIFDQLLRNTGRWYPVDGYGVRIPLAMGNLPNETVEALEGDARVRAGGSRFAHLSKTIFLKLHGSLNWGVPYISSDPDRVELCFAGALPVLSGSTLAAIENHGFGESLTQTSGTPPSISYYWRPFIVPPDINKRPNQSGLIRSIWNSARAVLNWASEIHVLGYSLPPSDFEADALFREGLYGASDDKTEKLVTIVNTDHSVLERFARYGRQGNVRIESSQHDNVLEHLRQFEQGQRRRADIAGEGSTTPPSPAA